MFSWLPRMRSRPAIERSVVLWQEIIFSGGSHGGEILFARSNDGGRTSASHESLEIQSPVTAKDASQGATGTTAAWT